ncbi:neprilysin isoform X2 [Octopus bimaculoides]|uniref:neprilysin isoform X2 n=1 Tax=Octopus bimaculoides TaxID=37653 RepID=UPI0022E5F428|nr:neprilysin isoform X2 [Octopus bimaculoides]
MLYGKSGEKAKGSFATNKEKWLTVILIILVICVLGLVIAVIILAIPKDEHAKGEKPCLTEKCLKVAVTMMNKIDNNIKPCDDFWKYACGDYIKRHPVFPFENDTIYSSFQEIMTKTNRRQLVLLTEENTNDTISSVKKIKKFFKTCIDPDMSENKTVEQAMWRAIEFGGIPIVTGNMDENVTRIELITNFAKYFASVSFLTLDPNRNFHTGDGNMLYLSLVQTYDTETVLKYIESIANQTNQTDSYNLTEITSFMETYKELADSSASVIDAKAITETKPRNLSVILKNFPNFDLESYINGILSIGDTKVENDSAIVILGEEQFQNLTRLLSETSLQTLLNIMSTSLFIEMQSIIEPSLARTKLHGDKLKTEKTRANHCLKLCTTYAPRVIGRMYVDKYFPKENRKKSNEIADYMGKALITVLEKNDWLDEQSKEQVLGKAKELLKRKSIGYDLKLTSDEFLEKRFENVLVNDNLYDNNFEYKRAFLRSKMKLFSETDLEDSAIINTFDVNAVYNSMFNTVSIPAAMLQPPMFDMDVAEEINFGGIGTIIGHEMMHAFDTSGIKYDGKGNLRNILTNNSQAKFDERAKQLIDAYSNFLMPRVNETVNGSLTIGENIADVSGMKVSYLAYNMWLSDKKSKNGTFPNLSLSREQLFFTAFSQIWCEIRSNDMLKTQLKTDVHSPAKARTMVTLQNFKWFSHEYHCTPDSKMNPSKKIEIW